MVIEMKFWRDLSDAEKLFYLLTAFGVFVLLWAVFFELDKSAIAEGEVAPLGKPLSINSAFDGVVSLVNVEVGQKVEKGDVLLVIDARDEDDSIIELKDKLGTLVAAENRLKAQLTNKSTFECVANETVCVNQFALLKSMGQSQHEALESLHNQRQLKDLQLTEMQSEIDSQKSALALAKQQLVLINKLVKKGYEGELSQLKAKAEVEEAARRVLEVERNYKNIQIEIESITSQIKLTGYEFEQSLTKELEGVLAEKNAVETKLSNLADRVSGYSILAPKDGLVSRVGANFIGQVIQSGAPMVDLLPQDTPLVFYAEVELQDISEIRKGQNVTVVTSNLDVRKMKPLEGVVYNLDPNVTLDEKTGKSFYRATIHFEKTSQAVDNILIPGMRGQAFFSLGSKSVLNYFMDPLLKSGNSILSE